MNYKQKYLKYKLKYLLLKQQQLLQQQEQEQYNLIGGGSSLEELSDMIKDVNDEFYEIEQQKDFENYEIAEKLLYGKVVENISEQEGKGNASLSQYSTPDKKQQPELPPTPKGERPQNILSITYNRLKDAFRIIKEELKEGKMNQYTFETLFNAIFQLDDKDDEQIMILNLVLFIKDFEHDYENYLKEEQRADDDRIKILINKCIRKLDEKIKLEGYSFDTEILSDEMLRQGNVIKQDEINDTYTSLLLRGILDDDFHFEIPEEEYDPTNVLQDQGYNPTGRPAGEINRIELDGLNEVEEEGTLLGTQLLKKDIYKFITEKWLKYIFYSLCRLEMFYLKGNNLHNLYLYLVQ